MPFFTSPETRRRVRERRTGVYEERPAFPTRGGRVSGRGRLPRGNPSARREAYAFRFSTMARRLLRLSEVRRMRWVARLSTMAERRREEQLNLRRSNRNAQMTLRMAAYLAGKRHSTVSVEITDYPNGTTVSRMNTRPIRRAIVRSPPASPVRRMKSPSSASSSSSSSGGSSPRSPGRRTLRASRAFRSGNTTSNGTRGSENSTTGRTWGSGSTTSNGTRGSGSTTTGRTWGSGSTTSSGTRSSGNTMNRNGGGSCTMTLPRAEPEALVIRLTSTIVNASSPPSEHTSPTVQREAPDYKVIQAIDARQFILGDEDGTPIDDGKKYSLDELNTKQQQYQYAVSWWFHEEGSAHMSAELLNTYPWLGMWEHTRPDFLLFRS